ncbi:MAG: hypothetical protein JWL67_206 [Solirubrobacterales bacterium]|nr:hypothetical protein [Solirubrobacterales bacterium]
MAIRSSTHTDRSIRYQSLSNFYSADSRRRASDEHDVGLWWRVGAYGPLYRAAWVLDTGELYVVRLGPLQEGKGEVIVLGRANSRGELEGALDGWQSVCAQPDSLTWLRHRAAKLAAPVPPARAFAPGSFSHRHGRAVGGRTQLRRPDARRAGAPRPQNI